MLEANYGKLAAPLVRSVLAICDVVQDQFEGDAERFHVLLVIGLRTWQHPKARPLRVSDVMSGEVDALPSLTTNVRSISDSTGIPRETVRRKVAALVEAGWVCRSGNKLSLTAKGSRETPAVRDAILKFAAEAYLVVAETLEIEDRDYVGAHHNPHTAPPPRLRSAPSADIRKGR
jgi:hypothetical protein